MCELPGIWWDVTLDEALVGMYRTRRDKWVVWQYRSSLSDFLWPPERACGEEDRIQHGRPEGERVAGFGEPRAVLAASSMKKSLFASSNSVELLPLNG